MPRLGSPGLSSLGGLRLRLIAGFGLVIAVSLVFAGFSSLVLLRDQQAESAEQRFGRLVPGFTESVMAWELFGWPRSRIRAELTPLADYFDVRIFLLDGDCRVILDTDDREPMLGATLNIAARSADGDADEGMLPFRSLRVEAQGADLYLFTSSQPNPVIPGAFPQRQPESTVVIAVPAADVTAAWARLLPRFAIAGGIAALVAVVVGTVLSARITRPIAAMTAASEAMAQGDYDQRIEMRGDDEVAQLAGAFNLMAGQANRSSHAMRQLLGNVSHELKTPLTSIQGFSQALVDGVVESEDERKQLAAVIHEEAGSMRELVDDLLYLSSIESGELALALDDVDFDALVAAGVRRLAFRAQESAVTVSHEKGAGHVRADGRRLEQILSNLVDNAIRFSPPDSDVRVHTHGDAASVSLEVHNHGEPIPEEDLPSVFDRFYQADRARSDGAHSGLGLAIVHELVQAHGGTIEVQSSRAGGTIFIVRLPRDGPDSGGPDRGGSDSSGPESSGPDSSNPLSSDDSSAPGRTQDAVPEA
jgi:signal transduction histidine kinase